MPAPEDFAALFGDDFVEILNVLEKNFPPELEDYIVGIIERAMHDATIFSQRMRKTQAVMAENGVAGGLIQAALLADQRTAGKIFGELRNSIKSGVVEGINQSGRMGQIREYPADAQFYTWVTVGSHKVCPDCDARAGEVMAWEEWVAEGIPGSGWSICGGHCYCVLDPIGKMGDKVDAPVIEIGAKTKKGGIKIRKAAPGEYFRTPGYRGKALTIQETYEIADEVLARAMPKEPRMTKIFTRLGEKNKAKVYGLKYRLKERPSLARKIYKESFENGWSATQVVTKDLGDVVRYTMLFNKTVYTRSVTAVLADIQAAGFVPWKVKNYWFGKEYKGINSNFIHKATGQKIEIQFHTHTSNSVKFGKSHEIYDRIRRTGISQETFKRLQRQLHSVWRDVDIPPGVRAIGEIMGG